MHLQRYCFRHWRMIEILGLRVNADLAVAELLLLGLFFAKCFVYYYQIEVQEGKWEIAETRERAKREDNPNF